MDLFHYTFPVSGVDTWLWLPPLAGFCVAFFSAMVGVSGAFLLLPFQMSVLQYTTPSVSATNLVFNLIAIPAGVYRYARDGRMLWSLIGLIVAGTLPGVAIGYFVRVYWLADPGVFKGFVGFVLAYLALRLLSTSGSDAGAIRSKHPPMWRDAVACTLRITPARLHFGFGMDTYSFSAPAMLLLTFVVGIVGGIYGVGGGAIIAPFCVAVFGLPIHAIAGASLAATFVTSLFGVVWYSVLPAPTTIATYPDWLLGALFGVGGAFGAYAGARLQRHVPQAHLKLLLGVAVALLAAHYLFTLLRG